MYLRFHTQSVIIKKRDFLSTFTHFSIVYFFDIPVLLEHIPLFIPSSPPLSPARSDRLNHLPHYLFVYLCIRPLFTLVSSRRYLLFTCLFAN